jgi:hypothetical protein
MLSRRCLLALVAGLALLWNPLWGRQAAADEQSDRVERLVKLLGSDRFAEHVKARRELEAIGAPALPALRKAAKAEGELGRRAAELVRQLEPRALADGALTPKKVRLKFKNTLVIDAVDELVRQSGYNIQIQGEVAGLAKRKVTFDTGETTFWQAFDRLCQEGGLVELASPAPAADPFLQDPRLNPGRLRIRPLPVQPLMPRPAPRKPRQVPGLPGVLMKVENGAEGPGQAAALALAAVQFPPAPGGNNKPDEQLKQLQQLMEKQLNQMLQQLEDQLKRMQQGQPGRPGLGMPGMPNLPGMPGQPGQPQPLDVQQLQRLMQQFRQLQLQQLRQLRGGGLQVQPLQPFPQLGGRNWAGAEPADLEIPQINVADGKPEKVPTVYAGALRIRLRPGGQANPGEAALALDLSVEPRVYGFSVGDGSRVDRAVDDQGQALSGTIAANVNVVRGPRGAVSVQQPVLRLKLGDKQARGLKELSGQLAGQVLAPTEALITVKDIFNAVGKTFKGEGGGAIEILAVEKKGDGEVQIQLRQESPPFQADGSRAASLPRLLDAKGDAYQLVQVPARGRRTNGRVLTQELTLLFRANPGQGDPSSLVLNGVRPVNVQVPFTVANVPLPEQEKR